MKRIAVLMWVLSAWVATAHGQPATFHTFSIPETGLIAFFRQGPLISAHRGGPVASAYPENCIETFEHILSQIPTVIELDVEMTADSVLILMHDNTLDRTTTGSGPVSTHTWSQLQQWHLKTNDGVLTTYKIPLFSDALSWTARNKAVLTVDVKRNVPYERVVRLIESYKVEDRAAVITYNANDALTVHRLNPRLIISANIRNVEELDRILAMGIPPANLIAFAGTREPAPELYERLKALDIPAILGVLGNLDNMAKARGDHLYKQFVERGASILATDRPVEAYRALKE